MLGTSEVNGVSNDSCCLMRWTSVVGKAARDVADTSSSKISGNGAR